MNEDIKFLSINVAVVTISDTRTLENDKSGDVLEKRIKKAGHIVLAREIVQDEFKKISSLFSNLIKDKKIDVIISTGGTGLTGRDITPEVMMTLFEKSIDGFGEMFRWMSYKKIGTSALQSRALAGVANGTYIFCLPGSPSACRDGWDDILVHQLDIRHKPCNFLEIMPRLQEHKYFRTKN
ncbi:molybdenum cofactor biosynthesis protein B [Alphaproteobacteria bacterium]|nr:molybdenum cofactor biosynthesis protein B [Alphaproteobacteria bacterium]